MQIESSQNEFGHKVLIKEVIKTIEDSAIFKKFIFDLLDKDPKVKVDIHVLDSYILTSSIIGSVLKMVQKDGANISLFVYNDYLYELLDKLNLITLLNVKKNF